MSGYLEGAELPPQTYRITRSDLVAYAAASGDRNPIHTDEDVARGVGLPGVIAHGMFTMALAARAVDGWAGAPGKVRELTAKFINPVVVPADGGTEVVLSASVRSVIDGQVTIAIEAHCAGTRVLGTARAVFSA